MKIINALFFAFAFSVLAGSAPAFSSTAYGSLNTATRSPERAFHGAGLYSAQAAPTTAPALDAGGASDEEIVVTATRKQSKFEKTVKKAAPYVFVAGVGLWMGLAIAGGAILPALAFAAVIMLFFLASK